MLKFVAETVCVMFGFLIASFAWSVWMELEKPECVEPATPMLTSQYDNGWDCAVVQNPSAE